MGVADLERDGDWCFCSLEEPMDAPEGSVWRKGTERYMRLNGEWKMSGSYEERARYEKLLEGH